MRTFMGNNKLIPLVKSPISQAVVVNKHCYVSGQLSTNMEGEYVPGTVLEEAKKAFENIFAIIDASGFTKEDIAFIDLAFIDLKDITVVNELYGSLFSAGKRPARTVYQAAALPYGGKIKVTAIAVKEE
jgi:2-iminobutanoate/2-iminopropanoate deaminase